jgi:hypothetical protein
MKVIDLRKLLENVPDDMKVVIPVNTSEFDGYLYSPCSEDSGVNTFGGPKEIPREGITIEKNQAGEFVPNFDFDEENEVQHQLFALVPCGFFSDHTEDQPNPEDN